jgi:glutathione synthase/RimK-type ligase-like ATP-grasp enzyme
MDPVTFIGLLCNCSTDGNPKEELSPSLINRAFLIDRLLRPSGIALFLYSPHDVTSLAGVPGYTVEGDELVASRMPIPRVNANWTYGTRRLLNQGMGYNRFKRWAQENQIEIYVPYGFSELVSNKRKAYEIVREYDAGLHPHTEDYVGSIAQIQSFLERADAVFIKPRSGNRGNNIFVLRKVSGGYSLKYYDQGAQRLVPSLTLEAAVGIVGVAAGAKSYIIQEGIESARFEGAVFDIRVVMVNDGSQWHSILETRLAPRNSDLSNVFQGGSIRITESILLELFGDEAARNLEMQIRNVSRGVAGHLDPLYPGKLMELGFDFLLDCERKLHLIEVNAKPGVAGFGSETKLFEWKPEDESHYQRWVYPHVKYVAGFLKAKVECPSLSGT